MSQDRIPPASEDDLKLDLEKMYSLGPDPDSTLMCMIRLAVHSKQEAKANLKAFGELQEVAVKSIGTITTLEAERDKYKAALDVHHSRLNPNTTCSIPKCEDLDEAALTQTE